MSEIKMSAKTRTEFGKGAARRERREDRVPAVIYGHGIEPLHVSCPAHDVMMALKQVNALIEIQIADGPTQLTVVKDVQRDTLKRTIRHVDFVVVKRGEKVAVDVAVRTEGDSAPQTLVTMDRTAVALLADATNIPTDITVSVRGAQAGTRILAGDLELPEGCELNCPADQLLINVQATKAEAVEETAEEGEGEGDAAE